MNAMKLSSGRVVTGKLTVGRRGAKAAEPTPGRVPRVSRLLALAIKMDGMLRDGTVGSQAELAAVAHVTRPRITQILNMLHLAPDLQEELLSLPPVVRGRDPITEGDLRPIVAMVDWAEQRAAWSRCEPRA